MDTREILVLIYYVAVAGVPCPHVHCTQTGKFFRSLAISLDDFTSGSYRAHKVFLLVVFLRYGYCVNKIISGDEIILSKLNLCIS